MYASTSGLTVIIQASVRPRGSREQRRAWLLDFDRLCRDRQLTVRYQELSRDGVPRFPVGVSVRDYE